MHTVPSDRILFGAFELNLSTGELRSIEAPDPGNPDLNNKVILREQVFQVLRMLLEREGEIVTREEIEKRLWASDTTGSRRREPLWAKTESSVKNLPSK